MKGKVIAVQRRLFGRAELIRKRNPQALEAVLTCRMTASELEGVYKVANKRKLTVSEVARKILVASASRSLK